MTYLVVSRWDGIETARRKGMTATNKLGRQISATRGAMILDCVARVLRTGGEISTTPPQIRADGQLVEPQQTEQERAHHRSIGLRRHIAGRLGQRGPTPRDMPAGLVK